MRFWIDFCCFLREKEGVWGGSEDGECPKTVESGEGDSGKGSLRDFGLIFIFYCCFLREKEEGVKMVNVPKPLRVGKEGSLCNFRLIFLLFL